jgi:hypothetical protein
VTAPIIAAVVLWMIGAKRQRAIWMTLISRPGAGGADRAGDAARAAGRAR